MIPAEKVRDRWMVSLLTEELAAYPVCAPVAELYRRRLAGDEPSQQEWKAAKVKASGPEKSFSGV